MTSSSLAHAAVKTLYEIKYDFLLPNIPDNVQIIYSIECRYPFLQLGVLLLDILVNLGQILPLTLQQFYDNWPNKTIYIEYRNIFRFHTNTCSRILTIYGYPML